MWDNSLFAKVARVFFVDSFVLGPGPNAESNDHIFFDGLAKYYPKAFDNQHPGVEAHNKFAVKIKETFLTKNYIKYI